MFVASPLENAPCVAVIFLESGYALMRTMNYLRTSLMLNALSVVQKSLPPLPQTQWRYRRWNKFYNATVDIMNVSIRLTVAIGLPIIVGLAIYSLILLLVEQIMNLNEFVEDASDIYVCISHRRRIPCGEGDQHLISNWPSDVARILEEPRYYSDN